MGESFQKYLIGFVLYWTFEIPMRKRGFSCFGVENIASKTFTKCKRLGFVFQIVRFGPKKLNQTGTNLYKIKKISEYTILKNK